jgi:uncharacterized protein
MQPHEILVLRDVRIPTNDPAVTLSADIYVPSKSDPVPALVAVLPYRKDGPIGIELDADLRWFAGMGYACLLVDFRGTGSSDGEQRPPFDPAEADDAIAAIRWAACQPWCSGEVGMWGHSYGAIMTLRTASLQPAHLKAILPIEGLLDPERDFVHPAGSTGLLSLALWGAETLFNQMLPPLHNYSSAEEQRRWRHRRQDAEPWLLDLVRHGPGHPVWRSRTVDAAKIVVPAFCVGGWRDLFCDASIRAFEGIRAPKKLLVGPWMHTAPHESPFEAIEFRTLALRWWDHWLKGIDSGIMDEPPVTVFVQGARPEWRHVLAWPPTEQKQVLTTTADTTLRSPSTESVRSARHGSSIAKWTTDATVGALSGLCGIPTIGFGLPLDQHADDARSITVTSDTIQVDTVVVGTPVVRVRWVDRGAPGRIVVRLTDVDKQGRSYLISVGVLSAPEVADIHEIVLNHTCYRLSSGNRLRVALGNADFPRLQPADASHGEQTSELDVEAVELEFRQLHDDEGVVTKFSSPQRDTTEQGPLGLNIQPLWTITNDYIKESVEVTVGYKVLALTPNREHLFDLKHRTAAKVTRLKPSDATAQDTMEATIQMKSGEILAVKIDAHLGRNAAHVVADIALNNKSIFTRAWDI